MILILRKPRLLVVFRAKTIKENTGMVASYLHDPFNKGVDESIFQIN